MLARDIPPVMKKAGTDVFSRVHPSVHSYLFANVKPFADEARGSYIPDEEAKPSYKYTSRVRSPLTISGTQRCFILMCPSAANDQGGVYIYNNPTGTSQLAAIAGGTFTHIPFSNLPESNASFATNNVEARCVSMGIKIRYTGPITSRGGTIYVRENYTPEGVIPDSLISWNTLRTNILSAQNTVILSNAQGGEHNFVIHPSVAGSQWFTSDGISALRDGVSSILTNTVQLSGGVNSLGNSTTASTVGIKAPYGIIVIESDSAALSFILEATEHVEYVGEKYNPIVTHTPVHVQDCNNVNSAIIMAKHTHNLEPEKHPGAHIIDTLRGALETTAKRYGERLLGDIMKPSNVATLATGLTSLFL